MASETNCICGAVLGDRNDSVGPQCGRNRSDRAVADAPVAIQIATVVQPAVAADFSFAESAAGDDDPLSFRDEDVGLGPRRPFFALAPIPTIMFAGFLGGFLGGFAAIASNFFKLNLRGRGVAIFIAGILLTVGCTIALPWLVECEADWTCVFGVAAFIVAQMVGGAAVSGGVAWLLQRNAIAYHRRVHGAFVPLFGLLGRSFVCGALTFGIQAMIGYPFFVRERVFYFRPTQRMIVVTGVPKDKALRFAERVRNHGLFAFDVGHGQDVVLAKDNGRYEIRFFVNPAALTDPNLRGFFQQIRDDCAQDPFSDAPLDVVLYPATGGRRIVIGPLDPAPPEPQR